MAREDWLPSLWGGRGDPFTALRRQIDDVFNEMSMPSRAATPAALRGVFNPQIDVAETEKELTITAELPGLSQDDVEVTMSGDMLTIRGEKSLESEEGESPEGEQKGEGRADSEGQSGKAAKCVYHRVERSWGAFQRSIRVPFDADPDQVTAEFKNGVLKVVLAKPETAQAQAKKIEIRPGT